MTIETVFVASQFVAKITRMAASRGLHLRVGSDFATYADVVRRGRSEQELGPPFDPKRHFLKDGNAFWIVGHDEKGRLVHTQAMRRLDLAGQSLSRYMTERFRDFPPTGVNLDLERSRYGSGPAAKSMTGTVIYHGDVWLAGDGAGYRGTGISSLLARFAIALAMLRFDPDHVFAFMPEPVAFRGLTEREGYMHVEPGSLHWQFADQEGGVHGFMIWMGRTDMEHLLRIPLDPLLKKPAAEPKRVASGRG